MAKIEIDKEEFLALMRTIVCESLPAEKDIFDLEAADAFDEIQEEKQATSGDAGEALRMFPIMEGIKGAVAVLSLIRGTIDLIKFVKAQFPKKNPQTESALGGSLAMTWSEKLIAQGMDPAMARRLAAHHEELLLKSLLRGPR